MLYFLFNQQTVCGVIGLPKLSNLCEMNTYSSSALFIQILPVRGVGCCLIFKYFLSKSWQIGRKFTNLSFLPLPRIEILPANNSLTLSLRSSESLIHVVKPSTTINSLLIRFIGNFSLLLTVSIIFSISSSSK